MILIASVQVNISYTHAKNAREPWARLGINTCKSAQRGDPGVHSCLSLSLSLSLSLCVCVGGGVRACACVSSFNIPRCLVDLGEWGMGWCNPVGDETSLTSPDTSVIWPAAGMVLAPDERRVQPLSLSLPP